LNPASSTRPVLFMLLGLCLNGYVFSAQLEPYAADASTTFSLPDLGDESRSLQDYRGKVVLVNFWASWCPPCIYEMPALKQLKQTLADKPFEIIAVNVGEKKYRVRKFAKVIDYTLPVLLDVSSETFDNWKVKILPTSFLVDASGRVRYRVQGNPGWDLDSTIALIEKLTIEAATINQPATQETRK